MWLSALCSTPRVSARNGDLVVEWRSEGDGRGVHGYRIQYRTDQSGWNPYGYVIIHTQFLNSCNDCSQLVPYVGDEKEYSQTLTGLQRGHNYYMHIQVWYTEGKPSARISKNVVFIRCLIAIHTWCIHRLRLLQPLLAQVCENLEIWKLRFYRKLSNNIWNWVINYTITSTLYVTSAHTLRIFRALKKSGEDGSIFSISKNNLRKIHERRLKLALFSSHSSPISHRSGGPWC